MGFDLNIVMVLMLDEKTGLPITQALYAVPEKFRRFINQKGSWFSNYVERFEGQIISVRAFLEEYPHYSEEESWSLQDHEQFKEALEWFAETDVFNVVWSY
jgi:hypothetical protein